jgi:hypothetical protein
MVDKFLNCRDRTCGGVAVAHDTDLRKKIIKFRCEDCGQSFEIKRSNYDAGLRVFNLGPGDWLRSGIK